MRSYHVQILARGQDGGGQCGVLRRVIQDGDAHLYLGQHMDGDNGSHRTYGVSTVALDSDNFTIASYFSGDGS